MSLLRVLPMVKAGIGGRGKFVGITVPTPEWKRQPWLMQGLSMQEQELCALASLFLGC